MSQKPQKPNEYVVLSMVLLNFIYMKRTCTWHGTYIDVQITHTYKYTHD